MTNGNLTLQNYRSVSEN